MSLEHQAPRAILGIKAGDEGFQVNVRSNTDLKGAVIDSTDKEVGQALHSPFLYGFRRWAVVASGGTGDAFASFVGASSNTSIGMPATPNSTSVSKRDDMLFMAYFREYVVKAGEPLTVWLSFSDVAHAPAKGTIGWMPGARCRAFAATLIPENGQDYEVAMDIGNDCKAVINEIRVTTGGVTLVPAPTTSVALCK